MTIPKGYMSTYGISKASGRPNPAVVPCHRAIDSNGSRRLCLEPRLKLNC